MRSPHCLSSQDTQSPTFAESEIGVEGFVAFGVTLESVQPVIDESVTEVSALVPVRPQVFVPLVIVGVKVANPQVAVIGEPVILLLREFALRFACHNQLTVAGVYDRRGYDVQSQTSLFLEY